MVCVRKPDQAENWNEVGEQGEWKQKIGITGGCAEVGSSLVTTRERFFEAHLPRQGARS